MTILALVIIGIPVLLLWWDYQLRRTRAEHDARQAETEAARAEGFRQGAAHCPLAGAGTQGGTL